MMEPRRFLPLAVLLGLTACSGARDSGLFGTGSDDASLPSEADGAASAATGPRTGAGPGTGTGANEGENALPGEGASPKPGPTSGPGAPEEPSAPATPVPEPACTQEKEPNDLLQRATPFESRVCGAIDRPLDVDFVEVVAPDAARKMMVVATESARLSYRIYEDGDVKVGSAAASSKVSVSGGSTYTIRISSGQLSVDKVAYQIRVTFEQ